ncbi:MAG: translesion error-prone DNA polymerase V autoproteolytic subunit [Desulfovibrio sp.]|nr:translesion error-prone DNA polymerase V autoproteolytic subunit [Desulfovibrio sp.]
MAKLHYPPHLTILGRSADLQNNRGLPFFSSPVQAGFPSPAEDDIESRLDLHSYCVKNPTATFFLRASGDSMLGAGIHSGDLLVVDRSAEATHGRIVIAAIEGELTVKRLCRRQNRVLLLPENPNYPEIDITEREYVFIWGVVTFVIHSL